MRIVANTRLGIALFLVGLMGCAPPTPQAAATPRTVTVAAAADLKFALDDLIAEFGRSRPDIKVEASYGASGNFYSQLANHAPFDIFFSADVEYPHRLIEQGLADKEDEFAYAVGHLVIWVPKDSSLDIDKHGVQALLDPAAKKVAIADPKHAPYGRAAEAALKKLEVYDKIKDRLVFGENVAQAAQFVETGAADAGLIPLSLALAPTLRDKGHYVDVPVDAYPRLDQGGVILSWAKDREAAQALRSFVISPQGKTVLRRFGFTLPGEGP